MPKKNKVFFTASHAIVAIMLGYGLALIRPTWPRITKASGAGVCSAAASPWCWRLYSLCGCDGQTLLWPRRRNQSFQLPHWIAQAFAKDQYGLPMFANLDFSRRCRLFLSVALLIYRQRGPVLILLCLLTAMPVWSGCRIGIKANSATTGSAIGSGTTCSRRRFGPIGNSVTMQTSRRGDEGQGRQSRLS